MCIEYEMTTRMQSRRRFEWLTYTVCNKKTAFTKSTITQWPCEMFRQFQLFLESLYNFQYKILSLFFSKTSSHYFFIDETKFFTVISGIAFQSSVINCFNLSIFFGIRFSTLFFTICQSRLLDAQSIVQIPFLQ